MGLPPGRATRLIESLAQRRDEALLYRRLATLRDDVPLREALDDLEWRGATADLDTLCSELGESGVPRRVTRRRD